MADGSRALLHGVEYGFRLAGVVAYENTVRVDVLEGFGVGVVLVHHRRQ